jgi:hybrid polyketide synthase/nonribosomal peptide synthetase ACE1
MTVAASNSAASVTLSGDQDRIKQAELVFKDEKKFVRLLKVDKAYHSHHMVPCVEPYLQALRRSEAQGNTENTDSTECQWFSSVTVEKIKPKDPSLKYGYWAANMMKPVLLKEALTTACSEAGPFDIVLEVGPHPALKSPASQTIQEVSNTSPLYVGLLNRGQNDVEAVADCLGTVWAHFPHLINLAMYDKAMSGLSNFKLLKGLPAYSWDHDREYWHEARQSRVFRTRESVHELLGHLSQDSSEEYYRWRNVLRMSEIPWLQGHKLQGQTVFPAAGYVVLALEAALKVAGSRPVGSLEVTDVTIGQALTFNDDDSGIETIFTISDIFRDDGTSFLGKFTYHGVQGKTKSDMTLLATGRVEARLGYSDSPILPPRSPPEPNLIDVDVDQFYTSLLDLGYGYSGPFRALSSMKRKLGWSTGLVSTTEDENDTRGGLIVHPGMLDATIQSVLLAYCYPNDGRLWSLHVPTAIRRITVDLSLLSPSSSEKLLLPFDATLSGDDDTALSGDVDVYTREGEAMLQIEGITCVPFSSATARDDRKLFSHETWTTATPDAVLAAGSHGASAEDYNLAEAVERTSYYYVRQLQRQIPLNHPARVSGPYVGLFRFVDDIITTAPDERHPFIKTEWKCDTQADIAPLISKLVNLFPGHLLLLTNFHRYGHTLDLQIAVVVGEQIPRVVFEETTILEHLMKDDLLYNYYSKALGFSEYTSFLAGTVAQITNRYPHMSVLEIGILIINRRLD